MHWEKKISPVVINDALSCTCLPEHPTPYALFYPNPLLTALYHRTSPFYKMMLPGGYVYFS